VGPKNSIQQTHSWAKFGRTQSRPDFSIICLIRTGPQANAVTVDHNQAVVAATIAIPLATEISNCKTNYDFENLGINVSVPLAPTAAAATTATLPTASSKAAAMAPANATAEPSKAPTGCRTTSRSTVALMEAPTPSAALGILPATPTSQTIEVTLALVMAPFLCDAIFNKKSSDPLKLILLAQEAAIEFDYCHRGEAGFTNASAMDHAIAFTNWALTIRLGKLTRQDSPLTQTMTSSKSFRISGMQNASCCLSGKWETKEPPANQEIWSTKYSRALAKDSSGWERRQTRPICSNEKRSSYEETRTTRRRIASRTCIHLSLT
jgi:hypothetical protein